jgi:hypothetical protein
MKQLSSVNIQPKVGECGRLNIAHQGSVTSHSVLIIDSVGEWSTIVDLQAHSQPNLAAGERLHWTNPHFQFEPLPLSQWPLAARQCRAAARWIAPMSREAAPVRCGASRSPVAAQRRIVLRAVAAAGRVATISHDADVVVTVA